jgi:hypothetical protein
MSQLSLSIEGELTVMAANRNETPQMDLAERSLSHSAGAGSSAVVGFALRPSAASRISRPGLMSEDPGRAQDRFPRIRE